MKSIEFDYAGKNIQLQCVEGDYVSEVILSSSCFYEKQELEYQKSLKIDSGIYVDVGAHIGTHAIFYSLFCNAKSVYAFEPNSQLFPVMRKNLLDNIPADQVFTYPVGLWDFDTEKILYTHYENNSGSNSVFPYRQDVQAVQYVDLIMLDDVNFHDRVVFLKLDIEGAEPNALLGGLYMINDHEPVIYCECHENSYFNDCNALLRKFDYRVLRREGEHVYFVPKSYKG